MPSPIKSLIENGWGGDDGVKADDSENKVPRLPKMKIIKIVKKIGPNHVFTVNLVGMDNVRKVWTQIVVEQQLLHLKIDSS